MQLLHLLEAYNDIKLRQSLILVVDHGHEATALAVNARTTILWSGRHQKADDVVRIDTLLIFVSTINGKQESKPILPRFILLMQC